VIVGYARTSTFDQTAGFEAQLAELAKVGVEKVFSEQTSAVGHRKALDDALEFCREGDTLIVAKLDRLARSVSHLSRVVETLQRKGVALKILNLNLDTFTPTGKLMINLLGSIAEFERQIMLERQRDGIAAAKAQGKYRGRVPTARRKADAVRKLLDDGINAAEVAKRLYISRASVYRIKAMTVGVTQPAQ
jgi:DNA invertase Pin-like site-specific DNA recombinase